MSLAPGKPGLGTSLFPSNEDERIFFDDDVAIGKISRFTVEFIKPGQSSDSRAECAIKAWLIS